MDRACVAAYRRCFPAWSPDGHTIAFITGGAVGTVEVATGRIDTLMTPGGIVDGTTYSARYLRWAPDGRTIYASTWDDDRVPAYLAIPAGGGPPRLLLRIDDLDRPSSRHEFATDGTYFYVTIDNRQADVWVGAVEGLTRLTPLVSVKGA